MARSMAKQMELFDDGGLMDEGGTTDPVSGNEVPPGSTQEEVRDDVPAQLSEGEFVFPADVVRYIGLETLMRMRQEAKMGLAQMEAMGQMGNSEEATIPDDLPFDMYDLEVEDDGLEMQVGGSVPATPTPASTVGSFVDEVQPIGGVASNLGIAPTPLTAASARQRDPNLQGTQFTPTTVNPVTPTFQQQIGAGVVGVDFEFVEYINEAGQIIRLRRSKSTGQMIDPIPEGFTERVKEETEVETKTTTGTGVQTAQVRDEGGDGGGEINTGDYGGPPGTFSNEETRRGLAMFSKEFADLTNPLSNPLSKNNIVNTVVTAINPVLGLVTRGIMAKQSFDNEISRLAKTYDFFTEDSLRSELGNLSTFSEEYAKAQEAIADARARGDRAAEAAAERAADRARSNFGDSAARAAGVTEERGKVGIEASGVSPAPGATLGEGPDTSGPSRGDIGDTGTGTPGDPGFGGAAPGGAPGGTGMGGGDGDSGGGMGGYGGYGGDPSEGGADAGRAKGGLIDKQMKRSGLASKK